MSDGNGARKLTPAELEQRRRAPRKHGATSEVAAYPLATRQKRSFLRRNGLRLSDLDGVGVALLDNWSRAHSKVLLLDDFFAREGLLDENGEPRGATKFYVAVLNSSRHALTRLESHLEQRPEADPFAKYRTLEAVESNGD